MTQEMLESAYERAAAAQGAAGDNGDYRKANAAYDEVSRVLKEVRRLPDRGMELLTRLARNENPHVRLWAATHLLPLDEVMALAVLSALTSEPPFCGINAEMTIQEWKAGRLKIS
ncbi:MAG: DUF2019 domain-containing protein [Planctomycetota bacterium]